MTKIYAFFALACLALAGCGGNGTTAAQGGNPYAGSYAGDWSSASLGVSGTANMTISSAGVLMGQIQNTTNKTSGSLSGNISNTGQVLGAVLYNGQPSYTLSGTLSLNQGVLSGNLIEQIQGKNESFQFTFQQQ